ncbi:DUF1127 domain-containing protein [Enterovirga sp.]|uniref:DUF1127 domain-containing protein n=1 Tax=Enterovirga sp. TaxID=2026350 RepID=UPI002B6E7916|nr:DUF1127 domain-containing protein [Enterovirga sp.]HMO29908.1 DUF1127 domain-containing protein [Enterovirga sp.]
MSHPASAIPLLTRSARRMTARPHGNRIADALRAFLAAAGRQLRLRRERRLLETLDDRALADLGLSRGSLDGAVRFGRGERLASSPEAERSVRQIGPPF